MTQRPDGAPGRRARALYFIILLAIGLTIVVAVLAYRQSPSAPPRGSSNLPSQAAGGSGTTPP